MSYILDALRKADAQRQRTRLPGLQAQPAAATAEGRGPAWRTPLPWALAAALLLVMGYLAWPRSPSPQAASPAEASMPPAASAAAPATPPAATVATPGPAPVPERPPAQAPVAASAIQPAPPPRATPEPQPQPQPQPRVAVRSTPDRGAPARLPEPPANGPAGPSTAAAPAPAPAGTAAPATEASAAPPGAPKLAITGGVYSADAAQRLLIVGGQVFNEGSEVAPGVVLEQVRPGQAVLSYQGQRFTARY